MRRYFDLWLLITGLLFLSTAQAAKFSGNVALEAVTFIQDAQDSRQLDNNLTLSFQPKASGEWNQGNDIWTVELFARLDDKDEERQHTDIREFDWLHIDGDNEWRIGINTVFWGVTESQHLVDIINQIDNVEGVDGEDKLGQPMIQFTTIRDWGTLELFVLPYFRERTFRGINGRLRAPLVVDTDSAEYESSDEEQHVDTALRYSNIFGDIELGLSYFNGTNRDPIFLPRLDGNGQPVLVPFYEQMQHVGIDVQAIIEDWIWKLEVIYRDTNSDNFTALTGGFEYSFYDVYESGLDIGTLVEYLNDSRGDDGGPFNNDLFAGLRLVFNDVQSTEILAGFFVDTKNNSQSYRLEGARRIGDSWKLSIEGQVFTNVAADDPLVAFEKDDFLLAELAWYF